MVQSKDIPDEAVLAHIPRPPSVAAWWEISRAVEYPGKDPAHPTQMNIIRAKLRSMQKRGLIDGCACGCHGGWHRTEETP